MANAIKDFIVDSKRLLSNRLYVSKKNENGIIDAFHKLYYKSAAFGKTWANTYFLGVQTLKCPLGMWCYQEILYSTRPDVIIETGTYQGGSALYMATICDAIGNGKIISIDIEKRKVPRHSRIFYINGSSVDADVVSKVRSRIKPGNRVMVILDSNHTKEHVLEEMKKYSGIVSKGCYMIVEDTNVKGHPIDIDSEDDPMSAIEMFMRNNHDFKTDRQKEKFLLSFNPSGYLLKIK